MEYYNNISAADLITRYAQNYDLNQDGINIDMVLKHWHLEKALTKQLFESTPENRKAVFYNAYNTLYKELPWLLKTGNGTSELAEQANHERWLSVLGNVEGKKIYEIGSGNGALITMLAKQGAICIGTEVSDNRPNKQFEPNLTWHSTDGINLTDYEQKDCYDLVLSDQVIEHFHPDDIEVHFKNVHGILKPGGKYIFYTPHYYIGPGDVSRIFGCEEAEGMHLKEYKYTELYNILKFAGFNKINIPIALKNNDKKLSLTRIQAFLFLEKSLSIIKSISLRKRIYHRLIKPFHIHKEIVFVAEK